jgi:hypothetical protein
MKIINQFSKLKVSSKIRLKFRKHIIDVFKGVGTFDYGIEIEVSTGKPINKEYDKFNLTTLIQKETKVVVIHSSVNSEDELNVFAYLIEYVIFEIGKIDNLIPSDIKRIVDDWLEFSQGKQKIISIEKQVGLIGELLILEDLTREFPNTNQLNNWQGPEGFKIDFVFNNKFGAEVKSRIEPFKDWVSISSIEQLDNELELQLLILCDFIKSDSGITLKQFADNIISMLNDRDKVNELIDKLQKVGYDYFSNYSNLIKVNLFRKIVFDTKSNDFPVLRKGTNLRIGRISYEINIEGLNSIDFKQSLGIFRSQLESN